MAGQTVPSSSHDQPVLGNAPIYLQLIIRQLHTLSQHSDIRYGVVPHCPTRFTLAIPFCYESLRWQVEYQRIQESWVPDLIFSDHTFNPLLSRLPSTVSIADRLRKWDIYDERQLHSLLKRVLPSFMAHQKVLIQNAAVADSRLQFELDTVAESTNPERLQLLFLKGEAGSSGDRAIFVVGVEGVDLSCLQPYFTKVGMASGELPPDIAAKLALAIHLKVVYQISCISVAPETLLRVPEALEAVIGKPRLPAWGSGTSLVEYLGEVVGALQRQCRTSATVAALRQDLLQEIGLTKLGPAVETDGMGARFASFQISHEGQTHTIFVDIPSSFPEDQPCLSLRRGGSGVETSFQQYPWSPRWEAKEMAKRIYSFVKEQIRTEPKLQSS